MKKEKITVRDIAKKAGVSAATVSRVLNHRDLVNEKTIEKVEKSMTALGLIVQNGVMVPPSEQPIILANIPEIDNSFYMKVLNGIQTSAKTNGYHVVFNVMPLNKANLYSFINLIKQVHAKGVILTVKLPKEQLDIIAENVPLMQCCEYNDETNYPFVSIDDYSAAAYATEYLITNNYNKIAMINGPLSFKYAQQRQAAFLDTIHQHDITIPADWVVNLPEISYHMAYSAASRLLNADIKPKAFFTVSDTYAAAVIRAAKKYNLNVPNDIAVIGFDNMDFAQMTIPSLTTVNQSAFQLGYTASELLITTISHPNMTIHSMFLDTELIIRESTSPTS